VTDNPHLNSSRILSLAAGITVLASSSLWADQPATVLGTVGPIEQIEVLLDGAWVTRSLDPAQIGALKQRQSDNGAEGQAGGADPWLWLHGLPGGLQTDSIVLIQSAETLNIPLRLDRVPAKKTREFRQLESEIDALYADKERNQSAQERVSWQLDLLKTRLAQPADSDQTSQIDAEQAEQKLNELISERTRLRLAARRLAQKLAELKEQQQSIIEQGDRYRLGLARDEIDDAITQNDELLLRYRVTDARWQPRYRAELDTTESTVIWSMAAEVEQDSGEDWPAVTLHLATADVRRFVPVPRLPRQTVALIPEARTKAPEVASRSSLLQSASAEMVQDATGFATRLSPKTPVAIAAGQPPVHLPVFEQTIDAQWQVKVAPQQNQTPVVVASFTPELSAPMPAGHWRLFRDKQEQAGSRQGELIPDKSLTMSFGIDPRITVDYQQKPDNRAVRGLVGRASQIERISSVTITNQHQRRIPVAVLMQMPIPIDEDIEVESMASTTNPTRRQVDGVENRWLYLRDLAAESEWEIDFSYRVRWPDDRLISPF